MNFVLLDTDMLEKGFEGNQQPTVFVLLQCRKKNFVLYYLNISQKSQISSVAGSEVVTEVEAEWEAEPFIK